MPSAGWRKNAGVPGTGHRRSDFLSDQTGFSHAGYHDFALATQQQIHGLGELGIQSFNECLHCPRLDLQHTPAFGKTAAVGSVGRAGCGLGAYFRGFDASHIRITRSSRDLS